jgi:hypothetical protein
MKPGIGFADAKHKVLTPALPGIPHFHIIKFAEPSALFSGFAKNPWVEEMFRMNKV